MNAKQKKAALVAELKGLVPSVQEGDTAAIERADEITEELSELDAHLAKAAEKAQVLAALGESKTNRSEGAIKMESKSLVERLGDAIKSAGIERGNRPGTAVVELKAATDTITNPNPGAVEISDRIVAVPNGALQVRDLFPTEQVSTPTFGFFKVTTDGLPGAVAEDGEKPQVSAESELVTMAVKKLAYIQKFSDEILEDYPRLVDVMRNRGLYNLDLVEENQLINGTGTGNDLTGLLAAGISTATYANGGDAVAKAEAILAAKMKIKADTGYDAEAIIMNPADFLELRLAKDANEQYMGGGFFQNEYGNGGYQQIPEIWGMKVALSPYLAAGSIIVGAFAQSAAVAIRGGRRLEVGYDQDDFSHDRVSTRVEERLNLQTYVPAGFVVITEAGE